VLNFAVIKVPKKSISLLYIELANVRVCVHGNGQRYLF